MVPVAVCALSLIASPLMPLHAPLEMVASILEPTTAAQKPMKISAIDRELDSWRFEWFEARTSSWLHVNSQ